MNKSKYSVLFTYFLASFLVLIAVANHFNFVDSSAADLFSITSGTQLGTALSLPEETTVSIAADFTSVTTQSATVAPAPYSATSEHSSATTPHSVVQLGQAARVTDTSVDAGRGIKIYRQMLYAHSTLAGGAFKALNVGDQFAVSIDGSTATYEIISRDVYALADFNSNSTLKALIYNYSQGLSLMTCGNGQNDDSAYRLVLLAKKIS